MTILQSSMLAKIRIIIGAICLVIGFVISQAENIPAFQSIVAPRYHQAISGLYTLAAGNNLDAGTPQFEAIMTLLAQEHPELREWDVAVLEVRGQGVSLYTSGIASGNRSSIILNVRTTNGQNQEIDFSDLLEKAKAMFLKRRLLQLGYYLFVIGLILEILPLFTSTKTVGLSKTKPKSGNRKRRILH